MTPPKRLETLQRSDVYFSSQSYRAQIAQYYQQASPRPLMFAAVHPGAGTVWDRIAPPMHDVLIISSARTKAQQKVSSDRKKLSALRRMGHGASLGPITIHNTVAVERSPRKLHVQSTGARLDQKTPLGAIPPGNPFASKPAYTLQATMKKPKIASPRAAGYKVHQSQGVLLPATWNTLLEKAFDAAQVRRDRPAWVQLGEGQVVVLKSPVSGQPVHSPQEAGFQQVSHPWKTLAVKGAVALLNPLLRLSVEGDRLNLPNGGQLHLNQTSWRDASGKRVEIQQVLKLPDGQWMKTDRMQTSGPLGRNELWRRVKSHFEKWEQRGFVRDLQKLSPASASG